MSEDETTAQNSNGAAPQGDETVDIDEHWQELLDRGLVKGLPPDPAKRVKASQMRPIRYHGTNDDLLRDLGRCR